MFALLVSLFEKLAANLRFLNYLYLNIFRNLVENEIKMASINQKDKVAHIGCGAIPYTSQIITEKTGANIVAIDNDISAIRLASKYINKFNLGCKIELRLIDARNFAASNFDIIIISNTVNHQKEILANICSSIKKETRIICRNRRFIFRSSVLLKIQ